MSWPDSVTYLLATYLSTEKCGEVEKRAGLRLAELQVFVSDLSRARAFYHDLLGLALLQESPTWLLLDAGGLELILVPGARPRPRQSIYGGECGSVLCLACGDIEFEHERLSRGGTHFLTPVTQVPQGRFAAFEDPDGNLLELIQPASAS